MIKFENITKYKELTLEILPKARKDSSYVKGEEVGTYSVISPTPICDLDGSEMAIQFKDVNTPVAKMPNFSIRSEVRKWLKGTENLSPAEEYFFMKNTYGITWKCTKRKYET